MPKKPPRRPRRSNPVRTKLAERQYRAALTALAREVGRLVSAFPPGDPQAMAQLVDTLQKYSVALEPWAVQTGGRMLRDVNARDQAAWLAHAEDLSEGLKHELRNTPTGPILRDLMREQVVLIKSLPLEAAQRVHDLTLRGLADSTRFQEIADDILQTGAVTQSRAVLIARTETARAASKLTEARAKHIGSDSYIWRTSGDHDVRESHKKMEGVVVPWAQPPTLSDGTTTHAGQIWNCRCWPEPIIPDD